MDSFAVFKERLKRQGFKSTAQRDDIARHGNVRVTDESFGAGVYEAVVTTLAERG